MSQLTEIYEKLKRATIRRKAKPTAYYDLGALQRTAIRVKRKCTAKFTAKFVARRRRRE